jgi:Bax protein
MKKIVSYRQKLINLARIYKINKVFDKNLKLTTYDIEIILLKNSVPLPSNNRGYISHKLMNEIFKPFYESLTKKLSINFNIFNFFKTFHVELIKKLSINFSFNFNISNFFVTFYAGLIKKLSNNINTFKSFVERLIKKLFINVKKVLIKVLNNIEEYFLFIIFNIANFFKVLTKTIIEGLNDVYSFQIKEKIIKNLFVKGIYASVAVILIFSGLHVKELITDMDSVKISLEIRSDKKKESGNKKKQEEVVKTLDNKKKNDSKKLAKLPKDKKRSLSEDDFSLNTQTVLNLFGDLEYDLDNVRNKKLVKPIYFTRLPKDLNTIKSVKEKKETFLQILLPLIVAENAKIKKDREYLLKIIKKNDSEKKTKWLNKKYKTYKIKKKNINELVDRIDIIPTSIALAQAAKESGWGTSRFALEGNAIYGQWTWSGDGIEPLEKTKNQNHKILKFPLLRASVKAYITNLNTHQGYKSFRAKRADLRKQNKKLAGLELIHELKNYAQTGKEYTKILEQIIKQNDLDELEAVTIEDFKKKKQLKL